MVELTTGEKLLIQRMLAEQCITENRAQELWSQLKSKGRIDSDSLEASLINCNGQLQLISLEIMGVVFPSPADENDDTNTPSATKYLALVDKHRPALGGGGDGDNEEIASATKLAFVKSTLGGPSAMNHRRAILQHLVDNTTATKADLINLKNEIKDSPNYTLDMAETCVDSMLRDSWIILVAGARRKSMQSQVAMGPRTYMELSDLLTEQFDMEQSQLPQQLYYR
mmetsp:Transcript_1601/g.2280  ORF Transcript_1601/g.2280 Transcript_1601/m.2280 type:complete len:226 (+) Transcript_1601:150-827(+)|eukprot:CAMPEP_0198146016 /NCGR_PEP_ID=MMETSP1443-20131203/26877_1 /TAXON_ID=186043 /ORGANISM="Entomoneis sp., Strain CCMP2396" /LENGTH=225 /DNA_ID=CAMNT_0043809817 /DNA_START=45 /DNA_END=722 /DNA_ORIENTATION=-